MNETREVLLKRPETGARQIRRNVWRALRAGGGGHAGGSCSAADVLAALYFHRMRIRPAEADWPDRDRFVLSKGHANAALGAVLAPTKPVPLAALTHRC
jgi:transketolase